MVPCTKKKKAQSLLSDTSAPAGVVRHDFAVASLNNSKLANSSLHCFSQPQEENG